MVPILFVPAVRELPLNRQLETENLKLKLETETRN